MGMVTGSSTVRTWLLCNAASGSNDDAAVSELESALEAAGFAVDRKLCFPDEPAPDPSTLDLAGVELLAIFGGDGTIHSALEAAAGWSGPVLVLPGGTMNMLAKRLHGDAAAGEVLGKIRPDRLKVTRPTVVSSRHGIGFSGALAGPGAVWNEVREALRAANVLELVASTGEAIAQSVRGPKIRCAEIADGRIDGYTAITVTPVADGLEAKGYYAETLGDVAGQGIALLNRDFRDGPHDLLGTHQELRLVCPEGEPMGLLIDGEPFEGGTEEYFRVTRSDVDLVTTIDA